MRRFRMTLCVVGLVLCAAGGWAANTILKADDNDGHGSYWMKRRSGGTNSWGIVGDNRPRQDYIWFNSFPGATGNYNVYLGAVLEPDGASRCRLFIDGNQVKEIRYPYSTGSRDCSGSTYTPTDLLFGTFSVTNGDQIKL